MYKEIYRVVLHHLHQNEIDINNPIEAIIELSKIINRYSDMTINEKKKALLETLTLIAAGEDGILYTDDDIFPAHVYENIRQLIEMDILRPIVDLVGIRVVEQSSFWYRVATFFCCNPRKNKNTQITEPLI